MPRRLYKLNKGKGLKMSETPGHLSETQRNDSLAKRPKQKKVQLTVIVSCINLFLLETKVLSQHQQEV